MMRHARAPRPKRLGLKTVITVVVAMIIALTAAGIISLLALGYVAIHG